MNTTLTESAVKLLKLIEERHEGMHFITAASAQDGVAFVQVLIPVSEMNKIADGMAVLASLVALNPAYVTDQMKTEGSRKHG